MEISSERYFELIEGNAKYTVLRNIIIDIKDGNEIDGVYELRKAIEVFESDERNK